MSDAGLDIDGFADTLQEWDKYFPRRVRLVACGGLALILQGLKQASGDLGLMAPEEAEYLAAERTLKRLGYRACTRTGWARRDGCIFDLFRGNAVHAAELLESPLKKGNSLPWRSFRRLSVSCLNDHDLLISRLFRGTEADIEDCRLLVRARGSGFDLEAFKARYAKTAAHGQEAPKRLAVLRQFLERL